MPRQRRQAGDTRPCCRCGAEFVLTEAQARNSEGRCRACRGTDDKKQHGANRERDNEKTRRYWRENRERVRELRRKHQQTETFKANRARYVVEHADKLRARAKVSDAIRRGRLQRQPCENCGTTEQVQAHHHDYSKPLDVHWLCTGCHGRERRSKQ